MHVQSTETGKKEFARIIRQARGFRTRREFVDIITGRGGKRQHILDHDTLGDLELGLTPPPNTGTVGAISTQTWYSAQELLQILQGHEPLLTNTTLLTPQEYFDLGCKLPVTELATALSLFMAFFTRMTSGFILTHDDYLILGDKYYTKEEMQKLSSIVRAARGNISYRDFANRIGNVSHQTISRIEKIEEYKEIFQPSIGLIGAVATQTPYSYKQILAIMQGRNPEPESLSGKRYFDLGHRLMPRSELVAVVQKLVAFAESSTACRESQ